MEELEIGEKVVIEVVEASNANDPCDGCCFNSEYRCKKNVQIFGSCFGDRRSDGKNIIYKEVKE